MFAGKQMEEGRAVMDYGIEQGSTMDVVLRMPGGMLGPNLAAHPEPEFGPAADKRPAAWDAMNASCFNARRTAHTRTCPWVARAYHTQQWARTHRAVPDLGCG